MHIVNSSNFNNHQIDYSIDLCQISNELNALIEEPKISVSAESSKATNTTKCTRDKTLQKKHTQNKSLHNLKKENLVCNRCRKEYKSRIWFNNHECNAAKVKLLNEQIKLIDLSKKSTIELFKYLPFPDEDQNHQSEQIELNVPTGYKSYIDQMCDLKLLDFSVLHLNINAVFNKTHELNQILETKLYDIVTINESKLDDQVPFSFYTIQGYFCLRRDRISKGGGGLLVFIKKQYSLVKSSDSYKNVVITFNLKLITSHIILFLV